MRVSIIGCIEIAMLVCNSSEHFSHYVKLSANKNGERSHFSFRNFNMNVLYSSASFLGKGNMQWKLLLFLMHWVSTCVGKCMYIPIFMYIYEGKKENIGVVP